MYRTTEKYTFRFTGLLINGVLILKSFAYLFYYVVKYFQRRYYNDDLEFSFASAINEIDLFPPIVDIVATLHFMIRKEATVGSNAAFWTLPILAVDLYGLVFLNKLFCENVKILISEVDFLVSQVRVILLTFVVLRYIGLAWNDSSCWLRRIFGPYRKDILAEPGTNEDLKVKNAVIN